MGKQLKRSENVKQKPGVQAGAAASLCRLFGDNSGGKGSEM